MKEQKPSVGLSDTSGVDDIQWTVVKVFQVSLHDLIFGSTTLRINDYPRQLALARMAAIYLCRKRTGLGATMHHVEDAACDEQPADQEDRNNCDDQRHGAEDDQGDTEGQQPSPV
jgi:hypothetical protein